MHQLHVSTSTVISLVFIIAREIIKTDLKNLFGLPSTLVQFKWYSASIIRAFNSMVGARFIDNTKTCAH